VVFAVALMVALDETQEGEANEGLEDSAGLPTTTIKNKQKPRYTRTIQTNK